MRRILFIPFVLVIVTSCTVTKNNLKVSQLNYCTPSTKYVYDSTYLPCLKIDSVLNHDVLLLKKFSYHDWHLANAAGAFNLLKDFVHLQNSKENDEDSIYVMIKRQQIYNRLILASTELASIAAELDCETERSKQLANYLDQNNDTRVQRLTIISVLTGAATAIVTSVSNDHKIQVGFGINGSIISAIFGGMAVLPSKQEIEIKHERNLLTDIWYQPKNSLIYPPFIWYVFNRSIFNGEERSTISESLRYRWIEQGLVSLDLNDKKSKLFFGNDGKYKADDLHTRTSMLNQLKAEIRSINQNLQSLMLKLLV